MIILIYHPAQVSIQSTHKNKSPLYEWSKEGGVEVQGWSGDLLGQFAEERH